MYQAYYSSFSTYVTDTTIPEIVAPHNMPTIGTAYGQTHSEQMGRGNALYCSGFQNGSTSIA